MTQQSLHSVRSTGTATGILMSPDFPIFSWLMRLLGAGVDVMMVGEMVCGVDFNTLLRVSDSVHLHARP